MYYYVEPGNGAVAKAFKKCGELMKSGETAIVVPQLSNLYGLISDVTGQEFIKALSKHKVIDLNPGKIRLFTKRKPPKFFSGPLLVAFTPVDQLQEIVRMNPNSDIVFVPWTPDEKEFFVKQYRPTLI